MRNKPTNESGRTHRGAHVDIHTKIQMLTNAQTTSLEPGGLLHWSHPHSGLQGVERHTRSASCPDGCMLHAPMATKLLEKPHMEIESRGFCSAYTHTHTPCGSFYPTNTYIYAVTKQDNKGTKQLMSVFRFVPKCSTVHSIVEGVLLKYFQTHTANECVTNPPLSAQRERCCSV